MLKRNQPYPLGDPLTEDECRRGGVDFMKRHQERDVMAIWDGRPPRHPRKGERYLSGANVLAYRAPNDFAGENSRFHIAKLVKIRRVERMVIIPIEGE